MKLVAIAAVVFLAVAAGAQATPAPTPLPDGGPILTDGVDYALLANTDGSALSVYDAASKRFDATLPSGCYPAMTENGLLACAEGTGGYDLRARRPIATPGPNPPFEGAGFTPTHIGRYWLTGIYHHYHWDQPVAFDRASGQVHRDVPTRTANYLDADYTGLERPMCAPLTQPIGDVDTYSGTALQPLQYERPWALRAPNAGHALVVERCGGATKTLAVARCSCASDAQLGAGIVTWSDGDVVRAYVLKSRRSYKWQLPAGHIVVSHTRAGIYVAGPAGPSGTRKRWVIRGKLR
jgi:hypothetical protein